MTFENLKKLIIYTDLLLFSLKTILLPILYCFLITYFFRDSMESSFAGIFFLLSILPFIFDCILFISFLLRWGVAKTCLKDSELTNNNINLDEYQRNNMGILGASTLHTFLGGLIKYNATEDEKIYASFNDFLFGFNFFFLLKRGSRVLKNGRKLLTDDDKKYIHRQKMIFFIVPIILGVSGFLFGFNRSSEYEAKKEQNQLTFSSVLEKGFNDYSVESLFGGDYILSKDNIKIDLSLNNETLIDGIVIRATYDTSNLPEFNHLQTIFEEVKNSLDHSFAEHYASEKIADLGVLMDEKCAELFNNRGEGDIVSLDSRDSDSNVFRYFNVYNEENTVEYQYTFRCK